MRAVRAFVRAYPWQSALVLCSLVASSLVEGLSLTALLPALSAAIDREAGKTSGMGGFAVEVLHRIGIAPTIGSLLLVMVVGAIATSAIGLLARRQVGYTVAQVGTDLRMELLRALVNARWEYYLRQPVGKLMNAMAVEASGAASAYLSAATMMAAAIQAIAYAAVTFAVNWRATLVSLVVATAIAGGLHQLVRLARRAAKRQTKTMSRLMAGLVDSLVSVKPLKAMGREDLADGVLAAQTLDLNHTTRRQVIAKEGRKAIQGLTFTIVMAGGAWAALEVWHLPMSTVMVLGLLLSRVLSNFGKVQEQYQELVTLENYYWQLRATLDQAGSELEPRAGTLLPKLEHAIRLDDVDFAYGEQLVIESGALEIPVGSFTSLVGPSGAGKTTLLDLIVGLVSPTRGAVRIDGVDLREIDMHAWRRMIGYVPQENWLLHDTVARNVTLGDAALGPADVEYALRAAGAWDFVATLPAGTATVVGERGARFSGGQRQRIMIARALAHRPRLLILDEATASLDPATEAALCETLAALRGEITILAISHQRALVDTADRVYRIEKGRAELEIDRPALREAEAPVHGAAARATS